MKKLIINADDFGLHPLVNEGIIKGYQDGIITSTSLMPSAPFFEDAVALAQNNPGLGIGIHLTLVAEGSVAEPHLIPSLVDGNGKMPSNYISFLLNFLQGKIKLWDIKRELTSQVEKALATGLTITHLDSHQHLHVFPGIIDVVLSIAHSFGIKAMRIPDEPYLFFAAQEGNLARIVSRDGLTFLARIARSKAMKQGILVPNHFFGMLSGGNMHSTALTSIIAHLPAGVSEIMMHPGIDNAALRERYHWPYHWQDELQAVTSPDIKELVARQQVQMVSFGELANE